MRGDDGPCVSIFVDENLTETCKGAPGFEKKDPGFILDVN